MNTIFTNGLKTAFLLGLMMAVCIGAGYLMGREMGMIIGFVFGGGMALVSFFFAAKIALASVGAQPVTREQAPELYDMTAKLAERAGIPMPRLYFSPEQAPNAFATGRNPKNGVVCVTAGLMNMMSGKELEGVVAHELSHIKHRDILISTIAAIMAGAIAVMANMAKWSMWFGGGGRDRDNGGLALLGMILGMILAPIAAMLIQMAISRSREYAADAAGAELCGSPEGLIGALKKLEVGNKQIPMDVNPALRQMFIVMPLSSDKGGFAEMFRTHPQTEKRIAKLVELMGKANPYT